jgi:hypothetical protein
MTSKNSGDIIINIVLTLLFGRSSKNIFMNKKPALIDSNICINQIKSLGRLPKSKISIKFIVPLPYVKPRIRESKKRNEIIIILFLNDVN